MIPLILGAVGAGAILGWLIVTISNARPRKRKKMPTLTKFVVFSLGMVIAYTITAIIYQWVSGQEMSSTLTTCFFACFSGEVLSASLIKIFKLKEENNADGFSDR
jgi:uncharacterized membrane protein AbrB (regulator of aidB expression)